MRCAERRLAFLAGARELRFFYFFIFFLFLQELDCDAIRHSAATAPARLRDNVGDVPFFSRPPSTGSELSPPRFPRRTQLCPLHGKGKRAPANFRYKNNGRVPHYFTLRAIVPPEDASRIVMRAAADLANCSRVISTSGRDREVGFVSPPRTR